MTNEEKFKAIVERTRTEGWCNEPSFISIMMIADYLDRLNKCGVVECAFNVTEKGKQIVAICEEFEWKPSDEDILSFVTEMVDKEDQAAFAYLIKRYRDDKDKFIQEINDEIK